MGRQSRPSEVAGSSPISFTHQKLLQKHTGGDFSALVHLHTPDFKSVQFLSQQHQNSPPSASFASSPAKHEREDSDPWQGGPSKMSQVTKDMATRMLHMTQFLRKKGPIVVWSASPPPPQHIFSSKPLHYPAFVRVAPAIFM